MATLEAIQKKIKNLQAQATAIAAKEASGVLDRIRDLMEKHGLTVADLEVPAGKRRGRKLGSQTIEGGAKLASKANGKLPPKYRDPKTGATWSGHARPPAWIKDVKDRSKFLIAGGAASTAANAAKPKKAGAYVRGPQPAMYRDPKTGAEWSGRGRAPAWIASVKDRTKFLIASGVDAAGAVRAGAQSKSKSGVKEAEAGLAAVAHGQRKGPQPAKYRDPKSGATWSGRGPAPAWLATARDRSKYLIEGADSVPAGVRGNKPVATKAGVQRVAAKKATAAKKVGTKTRNQAVASGSRKTVATKTSTPKAGAIAETPAETNAAVSAPEAVAAQPNEQ
jgi:DNA-binding protein H-NS